MEQALLPKPLPVTKQMTAIFEEAIRHQGFALINCFSPCVTFNKVNTYDWFRETIVNLDQRGGHDPYNREEALQVLHETGGVVTGILYRRERPPYHEVMTGAHTVASAKLDLTLSEEEAEALLAIFR